jgi:hypothetical protein
VLLGVRGLSKSHDPEAKWGRRLAGVGIPLSAVFFLLLAIGWSLSTISALIFG